MEHRDTLGGGPLGDWAHLSMRNRIGTLREVGEPCGEESRNKHTVDSPRTAQNRRRRGGGQRRERGHVVGEREREGGRASETDEGRRANERGREKRRGRESEIERARRPARRSRCTEASTSGQGHRAEG